jgi:hypothetical protein
MARAASLRMLVRLVLRKLQVLEVLWIVFILCSEVAQGGGAQDSTSFKRLDVVGSRRTVCWAGTGTGWPGDWVRPALFAIAAAYVWTRRRARLGILAGWLAIDSKM